MIPTEFYDHYRCSECFNRDDPCIRTQPSRWSSPQACPIDGSLGAKWVHFKRSCKEREDIKDYLLEAQNNLQLAADEMQRAKTLGSFAKDGSSKKIEDALDAISYIVINFIDRDLCDYS